MPEPNLSVIVLAWNQAEVTRTCIASIRSHTSGEYEVVLVDNGSDPPLAELLQDTGDLMVRNEDNLGFAGGMNSGFAAISGATVAFVNNDTVFPDGWMSHVIETLADYPEAGIVAPSVTHAGNPITVRSTPGTQRIVLPRFRSLPSAVVYVMRTDVMRALGGWNESYYPATAEDLDLLWTVWVNDMQVVLDERVLVNHIGSATLRTALPQAGKVLRRNRRLFVERWSGENVVVPDLGRASPQLRRHLLESAGTAAMWMGRAFAAEDERDELRREAATDGERRATPSPEHGRKRLLARLRRTRR